MVCSGSTPPHTLRLETTTYLATFYGGWSNLVGDLHREIDFLPVVIPTPFAVMDKSRTTAEFNRNSAPIVESPHTKLLRLKCAVRVALGE